MYHQQQNPGMSVPPNQLAKPNSPLNSQQQSIIPSPSPSGPITSSISPQNPVMNKTPTPQPTSSHLPSM
ncbi:unnamed protein product, partial [Rotaria sp. Silwood2]